MIEIVQLDVDLEKYGTLIQKTRDQSLTIQFSWDHTGAPVTFEAWIAIGHRGLAIDSFGRYFAVDGQELKTGLSCPQDSVPKTYSYQISDLLSNHYGAGETISDGAIRVVFKIPGQADRAGYLWDAFQISPLVAGLVITNIAVS